MRIHELLLAAGILIALPGAAAAQPFSEPCSECNVLLQECEPNDGLGEVQEACIWRDDDEHKYCFSNGVDGGDECDGEPTELEQLLLSAAGTYSTAFTRFRVAAALRPDAPAGTVTNCRGVIVAHAYSPEEAARARQATATITLQE